MATLIEKWNEKFTGADPAGNPDATNEEVGTNAVARIPPTGAYERGNDSNNKYGLGSTKSIIVELNSYAEGSNLGTQGPRDLGIGQIHGYASTIGDSTDARDGIEENGSRRKELELVVANTSTEASERQGTTSQAGTGTNSLKVVRGKYRTSDPSALTSFQTKTAAMATEDVGQVHGAFETAV